MANLFRGFKLFVESDDQNDEPNSFVGQTKKVFGVAKKLWLGMPLLLSNVKLGKHMVREPAMFYVTDFDDTSVTLTNVLKDGMPEDQSDYNDPDDEVDVDETGRMEVTISRDDFNDLQKPQTFQGMDTMSLRLGSGGM